MRKFCLSAIATFSTMVFASGALHAEIVMEVVTPAPPRLGDWGEADIHGEDGFGHHLFQDTYVHVAGASSDTKIFGALTNNFYDSPYITGTTLRFGAVQGEFDSADTMVIREIPGAQEGEFNNLWIWIEDPTSATGFSRIGPIIYTGTLLP